NYSPEEIRDMMADIGDEIMQVHGIQDVIMQFGSTGAFGSTPPDTIGNFQLQLINYNNRVKAEEIFADIRERMGQFSGLDIQVLAAENGPPAGKDINVRVESTNYDDLVPVVSAIRAKLESMPNTVDIED